MGLLSLLPAVGFVFTALGVCFTGWLLVAPTVGCDRVGFGGERGGEMQGIQGSEVTVRVPLMVTWNIVRRAAVADHMTSAPALDRALSSLDVRPGRARQVSLAAGNQLHLGRGDASFVYVREGELTGRTALTACTVDAASGTAETTPSGRTLLTGDALLTLGCQSVSLLSRSGAEVTVVPLSVTPTIDTRALPPLVFVSGFARAEPAAALLASHLGTTAPGTEPQRPGDETICRLMVTTVLLSALRAWAAAGDRATAWPPRADDPYLARVIDAVTDDPGHEWTLDQLALLGAMSRSAFSARFRRAFGSSPASFVTEVRMRRAKELLAAGILVSETSRMLGYASDEGFSRAFRRHTGVAPSAWRSAERSPLAS